MVETVSAKEDAIKLDVTGIKKGVDMTSDLVKNKKFGVWFLIAFLVLAVVFSSWIRTQNISSLKDVTTGDYTLGPDLDPFLYLRLAYEVIELGGLQNPDYMRYHGAKPYYNFVPYGIAYLHKVLSLFMETSVEYAAVIFPVIFFGASIIVFFFFVRKVFNKRPPLQKNLIAIFSTLLYIVTPLMLHRTVAGVPELESAGLFFFWLSFLLFLYAWEDFKDGGNRVFNRRNTLALLSGISTAFMVFTWGGFKFIMMALPLTVLCAFILEKVKRKEAIVYGLWFAPSIIFLIIKSGFFSIIELTTGFLPVFVFFVLLARFFIHGSFEEKIRKIIKKDWVTKEIISILVVLIAGVLVLLVAKPGYLLGLLGLIKDSLLYPFGRQRVGVTVAENAKPYVVDWLSQFGKSFFWMFFLGTILLFHGMIKHLQKKEKVILNAAFIIFIFGFVFSRYSAASTFNGENFISQIFYFGSLLILVLSLFYVYIKRCKQKDFSSFHDIEFSHVFILSLIILMIIASRGAIRLFVISSPIFIIAASFLPVDLFARWKDSKDDILRIFLMISMLAAVFFLISTFISYEKNTTESAKYTVPSGYNIQWQQAMSWVKENTPKNSIFVHWWDYGYWVQTLGERPTVTDGGHENTYWDHLIGRYVLTTQNPESALSFMKTHNVSYLLIDSTDVGKYPAYSSIGSDSSGGDRYSQIPIMVSDQSQIVETSESEKRIYQGGGPVDEDIVYSNAGNSVFLPSGRSYIIGMIIETSKDQDSITFKQPIAVFIYNNEQMRIPLRYLYYRGKVIDFKTGVEAVARITQEVTSTGMGSVMLDELGSLVYLSPKVSKGLFAQLYLMNDALGNYKTIKLVHSEPDLVVSQLASAGLNVDNVIYFQGIRGPINIWEIDFPENIIEREEFLRTSGDWAEFDDLIFTR